jgi:hypothetical protein
MGRWKIERHENYNTSSLRGIDGRGQGGEVINWWKKEERQIWTAGHVMYTK